MYVYRDGAEFVSPIIRMTIMRHDFQNDNALKEACLDYLRKLA